MKKAICFIVFTILVIGIGGCGIKNKYEPVSKPILENFSKVEMETLLQDASLNVRAIDINEGNVVAATSNGEIYRSILEDMNNFEEANYFSELEDSIKNNFRSIAFQADKTFSLSIASPARLYNEGELVYQENHPKVFYDALDFWNDQEGIAIGDPTDDCMSIIITRDGGNTWSKISCNDLPKAKVGEAAFAASDTNIAIVGNKTWVATGGKASRILFSPDKGKTWEVFETPIIQGLETTGIYSVAFYDEDNGFAIGGDYTKAADSSANKIRTQDGGKTWQLVAPNKSPGYRSCVQYMPNSSARVLVAVGFKGIDISNDAGNTWKHLSDEGFYTLRFLNDSIAYAAGAGRISKLSFKE
ncbi:oxidoreductase [Oceanihabitans sp. 2_MG-2023]|uniref:sialidase family protein n=1 Tax=Oceanihabitans sp. 2_MG-2023 TaxID=3062661 RepID=UPI0026E27A69|nr:oxidoreductase [Oceanihabitans sp. 2_MG-2023]MDO6597049.1 oxidoreductase [Oceanihabitans sp. 2_MG-2023]